MTDECAGRLDNKVAIVTGGGGEGDFLGVGAAICEVLASRGCSVAVFDSDASRADATVSRIKTRDGSAVAVEGDVTQAGDCERAIGQVLDTFGRLDIVVNNVAIEPVPPQKPGSNSKALPRPELLPEVSESTWDLTMAVNVKGMMLMAKYSAAHMGPGASIITISSSGWMHPAKGTAAYVTSKGAVVSLTLAMAVDLAPVRANCICPDRIWTPMFARRLPSDPEQVERVRAARASGTLVGTEGTALDVARAAAFLASDDAQWITGQVLTIDGGRALMTGVTEAKNSGWAVESVNAGKASG